MSETMFALLGFATIIMIIASLLKSITVPAIASIDVSTVTALILVLIGTFTIKEVGGFIKTGVRGVHSTAALFIFSVLFFGIMTDAEMFDYITNVLMERMGHNVVGVAPMTCIIAMIRHLDGGGTSTSLITIPVTLPVCRRLKMRPTTLPLICVTTMGIMNLLPWGGPTMRAASVLEIESNVLWTRLMPMQIVGVGTALFTVVFRGFMGKKKGAGIDSGLAADDCGVSGITEEAGDHNDSIRPGMSWFNVYLTLFIIVRLIRLSVPSYYTFMSGCVIAPLVSYPGTRLQNKIIKFHAGPVLMIAPTILAADVFLGVLEDNGIIDHMANVLALFIPQSMGRFLLLIIGVLSMPPTLMFCTDSYFYGLLPVLTGVGNKFDMDPVHIGIAMVVCRNCAILISPVVPITLPGVELVGVETKNHIRTSFFWIRGISLVCMVAGLLLGVFSAGW